MTNRYLINVMVLIAAIFLPLSVSAQQKPPVDAEGHQWWQHAVFYEIYPRSFADSNNDGIGDLKGITSQARLPETISASTPSGSLRASLLRKSISATTFPTTKPSIRCTARSRISTNSWPKGRNATSRSFWISSSTTPPTSTSGSSIPNPRRPPSHRDWYIWRDGKGPDQPPNNWLSTFGGSGWNFDPTTEQYYYHYFYPEQPDLNWRNPAVEKAMLDVTRFWYKRGVAGFRLDAVDTLYRRSRTHRQSAPAGHRQIRRSQHVEEITTRNLPEVHDAMRELRNVADEYDAVLIGETWTTNVNELKDYYGATQRRTANADGPDDDRASTGSPRRNFASTSPR